MLYIRRSTDINLINTQNMHIRQQGFWLGEWRLWRALNYFVIVFYLFTLTRADSNF